MEDEHPKGWPVPVTDLLPLTLKSTPLCQIWENKSVPFRYLFLLAAGTMLSFVRRRQWRDISGRQGLTSWPQSTHQAVPLGARQARWVAARLPCDSSSALQAAGAGGPRLASAAPGRVPVAPAARGGCGTEASPAPGGWSATVSSARQPEASLGATLPSAGFRWGGGPPARQPGGAASPSDSRAVGSLGTDPQLPSGS